MNMLKMCMNPKVLLGLGAVAVGILVFAPNLLLSALPILLLAACPLSMLLMPILMGKRMGMGNSQASPGSGYTCPMHAEVQSAQPGRCPKCGMPLVAPPTGAGSPALSRDEQIALLQVQLRRVQEDQAGIAKQLAGLSEPSGLAAAPETEEQTAGVAPRPTT